MGKAQIDAFARAAEDRYVVELAETLARHYPDGVGAMKRGERLAHARSCLDDARERGIETTGGVTLFADIRTRFGAGFAEAPETAWMAGYMEDPCVPDPEDRIRRLHKEVVRRDRMAVASERARKAFAHGG